jgi:cytochrome c peroxidase
MRAVVLLVVFGVGCSGSDRTLSKEQLGELIFHDTDLSEPRGQACADCHDRKLAFSDPEGDRTSMGVVRGRMGVRNAQTAMYASFAPPLHRDPATNRMVGGLFWDGRAATLESQAAVPFLNPLEMNLPNKAALVERIRDAEYADEFRQVFGARSLVDVDGAADRIFEAIAAFERTTAFAPFSSKYDRYLAGQVTLDEQEARGLATFEDPARGNCASCHPSRTHDGTPPLFTDFSYANIGVPKFVDNPFYGLPPALNPGGDGYIDRGLATTTGDPAHAGMFRVPTLRNVARTSPYTHNGYFRRLEDVLEHKSSFATKFPPEVPETVDRKHVGTSNLTPEDIADLVAFLRTLTDS